MNDTKPDYVSILYGTYRNTKLLLKLLLNMSTTDLYQKSSPVYTFQQRPFPLFLGDGVASLKDETQKKILAELSRP